MRLTGPDGVHRVWTWKTWRDMPSLPAPGRVGKGGGRHVAAPSDAMPATTVRTDRRGVLALAVPALGALVAEPLFLLADSAIVGRLGTVPLAGLGIAGGLLSAAVSIFVFLAYGT